MPPTQLHVTNTLTERKLVSRIECNKVDEREAEIIHAAISERASAANHKIALDMSRVRLLASVGLGMLINLHKECSSVGGKLVLYDVDDNILQVLKLTKLHKLIKIVDNADAATKILG